MACASVVGGGPPNRLSLNGCRRRSGHSEDGFSSDAVVNLVECEMRIMDVDVTYTVVVQEWWM